MPTVKSAACPDTLAARLAGDMDGSEAPAGGDPSRAVTVDEFLDGDFGDAAGYDDQDDEDEEEAEHALDESDMELGVDAVRSSPTARCISWLGVWVRFLTTARNRKCRTTRTGTGTTMSGAPQARVWHATSHFC